MEGQGGAAPQAATPQGAQNADAVNRDDNRHKPNQGNPAGGGKGPGSAPGKAEASDPVAKAFERFKIKVDGREEEVDLDTLKASYSKAKAADKRFEEASKLSKRAEALENAIKEGDFSMMLKLGLSREQVRAHMERFYHREFIEPETMTPEQKRLREAEERLKKYEEDEKKREADREREESERMDSEARQSLEKELIDTLEKSGLPKKRFYMARIAYWTKQNLKRGWDAPQEVIINQVKKERDNLVRSLLESHEDESIFGVLGDKVADRIRKLDLERIRKKRGLVGSEPPPREQRGTVEREPTSKKTLDDVDAEIRQMFRKKR